MARLKWLSSSSTHSTIRSTFLRIFANIYSCVFLMMVILTDVRWYLIVTFICISLISNDEHLYMSHWLCFLQKNVNSGSLNIFLTRLLGFFWEWIVSTVYIVWTLNPLSVVSFANIFFLSVSCLFILSMVSFAMQNLLSLISPIGFPCLGIQVQKKKKCC